MFTHTVTLLVFSREWLILSHQVCCKALHHSVSETCVACRPYEIFIAFPSSVLRQTTLQHIRGQCSLQTLQNIQLIHIKSVEEKFTTPYQARVMEALWYSVSETCVESHYNTQYQIGVLEGTTVFYIRDLCWSA